METLLIEHKEKRLTEAEVEELISLWQEEALTYKQLSEKFGISESAIGYRLRTLIPLRKRDRIWEKEKRIHATWREFKQKENETSKKDKIEILEQLRKEFEGEEKSPGITINKIEVLIEFGTSNVQDQEKRSVSKGNFIDIEASSMLVK